MATKGIIIYGGSFNPLHCGHMRLAIESLEWMQDLVCTLQFLPSAHPPHKIDAPMLPFNLRAKMIGATIAGSQKMSLNILEAQRQDPSYTWDTISLLRNEHPQARFYFLLGSQDFRLLREWKNGLQLPLLCDLLIAPRGDFDLEEFLQISRDFWPDDIRAPIYSPDTEAESGRFSIALHNGAHIYYLPIRHLDISSSYIRELWLCGKNPQYLVPSKVYSILEAERNSVSSCWQNKG